MHERDEHAIKEAVKAMTEAEQRKIVKEAIKELMGEYIRTFGWWSTRTLSLLVLGALILFILQVNGWTR